VCASLGGTCSSNAGGHMIGGLKVQGDGQPVRVSTCVYRRVCMHVCLRVLACVCR